MTPEKQNHVKQHRRKSDKLNKLSKRESFWSAFKENEKSKQRIKVLDSI